MGYYVKDEVFMMPQWSAFISYNGVAQFCRGDLSRRYELASLSKTITALATVILCQENGISLDSPISPLVPEMQFSYRGDLVDDVTIRMLLCHTAGLGHRTIRFLTDGERSIRKVALSVARDPLRFRPGMHFCYATGGYVILGALIEALSGMSFADYCKYRILVPLRMFNTDPSGEPCGGNKLTIAGNYRPLRWNGCESFAPAGFITSTIKDMNLFLEAYLGLTPLPKYLEDAIRICQDTGEYMPVGKSRLRYGFGWYWDDEKELYYHDGCNPGFSSYMAYSLSSKLSSIWMAECNDSSFRILAAKQIWASREAQCGCCEWVPPRHLFVRLSILAEIAFLIALVGLSQNRCSGLFVGVLLAWGVIRIVGRGLSIRQIILWANELTLALILLTSVDLVLLISILI